MRIRHIIFVILIGILFITFTASTLFNTASPNNNLFAFSTGSNSNHSTPDNTIPPFGTAVRFTNNENISISANDGVNLYSETIPARSSIAGDRYILAQIIIPNSNSPDTIISQINWTSVTRVTAGNVANMSFFMWNYTSSSWFECASSNSNSTGLNSRTCSISDTSNFINSTNYATYLIYMDNKVGIGQAVKVDYIEGLTDVSVINTTLVSPSNNAKLTSSLVNFNCSTTETTAITNTTLYGNFTGTFSANQTNIVSGTSNSTNFSLSLPDGNYIWNCLSTGTLNNYDFGNSNFTFLVDTIKPAINISSPQNNSNFITTSVQINFTATDTNLQACKSSADGGVTNVTRTCASGVQNNFTDTYNQGNTTVIIYANDSLNNVNSTSVKFFVDSIAPVTTPVATSPPGGSSYTFNTWTNSSVQVTMAGSDAGGFNNLLYPVYCIDTINTCTPTTYISSGVTDSTEGTSYIRYRSIDNLGNTETTQSSIIKIDTINPSINLTFPLNISYNSVPTALNYTVSDTNLQSCWYSTDAGVTNHSITCGTNVTGLSASQGSNTWLVGANDTINNKNSSKVTFFVDSIAPSINITYPINSSFLSTSNHAINYTLVEVNVGSCWWTKNDGVTNTSLTCGTNITGQTWTEGINNITIYANDSLNNVNSTSVRFTTDFAFPLISYQDNTEVDGANLTRTNIFVNVSITETTFANITFSLYNLTGTVNSTTFTSLTNTINWTNLAQTNYSFQVNITDQVNNKNFTAIRRVVIDNTAPTIAYVSPTQNDAISISRNFIEINVTAADSLAGLSQITVRLFNSTQALINTTNSSVSPKYVNISSLADGLYYYNFSANDSFGNSADSSTRTITLDTTKPSVTINKPTSFQNLSSSVQFNITLNENGSCQYSLNSGVNNVSMTNFGNRDFTSTNSSIADGTYTMSAYCNDTVGNTNLTSNVTFAMDSTVPKPTIVYPLNISYNINVSTLNYTFVETNPNKCWYSTNAGVTNSSVVTCGTNFTTITSTEGSNTWYLYMNDSAGNLNSTTVTFFKDSINPAISITSPVNNNNSTNLNLDVNYTVSDTNLQSCWWTNNSGTSNHSVTCGTNVTGQTWLQGINNITVYANDTLNNFNSSSITFFVDSINPIISIVFPVNLATYDTNSLNLNYTVSDTNLQSCWFRNNTDTTNQTVTCGTNTTISQSSDGNYLVYMWANDSFGNVGSDFHTYTISTSAPAITLINPTNGSYSSNSKVWFNYTAVDSNGVNTCQLWGNWTGIWQVNLTNYHAGDLSVNVSEGNFNQTIADGYYMYNIFCNDTGNAGTFSPLNFSFGVDTIFPLINFTSNVLVNNTNTTNTFIYVNVTASDLNENAIIFSLSNQTTVINSTSFTDKRRNFTWTNLPDGLYYYNVSINDSANNRNSTENRLIRLDDTPPSISISSPLPQNYGNNNSLSLNYTAIDNFIGLQECWYYIQNSSGYTTISTISLPTCANTTFSLPSGDINYNLNLFAKDIIGNTNVSIVTFGIRTNSPAVVLYPTNDTNVNHLTNNYFNFTVTTNANSISSCQLWGNFNSTWSLNQTISNINYVGGMNNFSAIPLTEGTFLWNVNCSDNFGHEGFALNNNSYTSDITYPIVNITMTNNSAVSTSPLIFTYNITDLHLGTCKYNLFDDSALSWVFTSNQSMSCTLGITSTAVASAGAYDLYIWGADKSGNENSSLITVIASSPGGTPGGGGGAPTNVTVIVVSNSTFCGDNFNKTGFTKLGLAACQVNGNDLGVKEDYFSCPQDCPGANIDTVLFGCFTKDPKLQCAFNQIKFKYLGVVFGLLVLLAIFAKANYHGKNVSLPRYVQLTVKEKTKRKKR